MESVDRVAWTRPGGRARLLCALALLLAAPLAGADFTPQGTQPGLAATLDEPLACASCHGAFEPGEANFLPHSSWSGSLMSNAARDPIFWAALDVANRDLPGVGDFCLRCHSPAGWLAGRVRKDGAGGLVDGTNGCRLLGDHDNADTQKNDYAGVTCHLCHRLAPTGPAGQRAAQGNGNFWLDDSLECDGYFGPCRRGPYAYGANDPLAPPHAWVYSRHTQSSEQCGTCHDVSSPDTPTGPARTLILADGTDTGLAFPADRTYSEWKQSAYAAVLYADSAEPDSMPAVPPAGVTDCQDCHMRRSSDPAARACQQNPEGSRAGGALAVHEFAGGNVWAIRLLKGLYGVGLDRIDAFDRSIAWAQELLSDHAADIAVDLEPWAGGNAPLSARVRVTNRSGHKLPTGYAEGRRIWLQLVARDATQAVLFQSGTWNPATGELPADPQLKVYETVHGIWDAGSGSCRTTDAMGRKQFHFVLNNCITKDNRIPPQGFRLPDGPGYVGATLAPVGYSYPETAPGSGVLVNHDDTQYLIPLPPGAVPPITVTATLQHQTSSREYIEFLRNEAVENAIPSENAMCNRDWTVGPADRSRGQFLHDLWSDPAYGRSPPTVMVVAAASTPQ